jgi:uncharacterized membrane-anchored protein YhcB (DUF1043 family)
MSKLPDFTERDRRRLLVNEMHMKGFTPRTIIARLEEEDPPVWPNDRTLSWKLKKVKEDLDDIRQENLAAYAVTKETTDAARVDYLGILQSLYEEARETGNLTIARNLAKDIAHAHGLETEEPVGQSMGDPIKLLAVAVQGARQQLKSPPPQIEEATLADQPGKEGVITVADMQESKEE